MRTNNQRHDRVRAKVKGLVAVLLIASGLWVRGAGAQDPPLEWGEIAEDDLAMTVYPDDSTASAAVLVDYGVTSVNPYSRGKAVRTFQTTRLKLFSEEGYEWATVVVDYNRKMERVSEIAGHTFVRSGDGKVERKKLSKKDIYHEDVDEYTKRVRFTLPGLEPGAVVEYRYQIESENFIVLPTWVFQHTIPTRWSEYRLFLAPNLQYTFARYGFQFFDEGGSPDARETRFVLKDVPAFTPEPFMTSAADHVARVGFQLSGIFDGGKLIPILGTWTELAEEFGKIDELKDFIALDEDLTRGVPAALAAGESKLSTLRRLYEYVQSTFVWNGVTTVLPTQEPEDLLEKKSGTSADINLYLLGLLRSANLDAHPVATSTRSHGRLEENYPTPTQFNQLLVCARIDDDTTYLVDATDPHRPLSLLPVQSLNRRGLLLDPEAPEWIAVEPASFDRVVEVHGEIDPNGNLQAEFRAIEDGYAAFLSRESLLETADEAYIKETFFENLDVSLDSIQVTGRNDVDSALVIQGAFDIPAYAASAGGLMFFSPLPLTRWERNPFAAPERSFPVDFAYPRNTTYRISLGLPEGYEVDDYPPNMKIRPARSRDAMLHRSTEVTPEVIQMTIGLQLLKAEFATKDYRALRIFFDRVVSAHAEQVVLKRKESTLADGEP